MLAMPGKGPLFALSPEFYREMSRIAGEVMEDNELMNDMSKKKPPRSEVFDSVARRSVEEWYTAKKGGISEDKLLQYASVVATLLEKRPWCLGSGSLTTNGLPMPIRLSQL